MEMINRALADADMFKKMLQLFESKPATNQGPGSPEVTGRETRQQRRARERAIRKAAKRAEKV